MLLTPKVDPVELVHGRPNYLSERNAEIKARTHAALQRSSTLRKMIAASTMSPPPSASSIAQRARQLERESNVEGGFGDDDAAYIEAGQDVLERTVARDAELAALRPATTHHVVEVGSVFLKETLVETQHPTPSWKRVASQSQGQKSWQGSLRSAGPSIEERAASSAAAAGSNKFTRTALTRGNMHAGDDSDMVLARLAAEQQQQQQQQLPSLSSLTQSASSIDYSSVSTLSVEDAERYFGTAAKQRYYKTYHELDRQRKIIHYKFDKSGMLLDSLYQHANHPADDNVLHCSVEELRRIGVLSPSPPLSPRE